MLNEAPLLKLDHLALLKRLVQIRKCRRLFRDLNVVIGTHLIQVLLQDHAGYRSGSSEEANLGETLRRIEFRVKEIGLNELFDIEQGRFEPLLNRSEDRLLLAKMRNRRIGSDDLLFLPSTRYIQPLKTIFYSIAFIRDVLALRLLIVTSEVLEAVRQQLPDKRFGFRIPFLVFSRERWKLL
jgi:hypothetical protein